MTGTLVGIVLLLASAHPAAADDWQYCLAPSSTEHKVYMTPVFPVARTSADAASAFAHLLERAKLAYDVVQCPRADDETSIVAMQQYALSYNRETGNRIVWFRLDRNAR